MWKIKKFVFSLLAISILFTFSFSYSVPVKAANPTGWTIMNGNKYFFNSLGNLVGGTTGKKILDISSWQGTINWDAVKTQNKGADAIDGVIIRCAAGTSYTDPQFQRNLSEVRRLKIPYGVYIYSYAGNKDEGIIEAQYIADLVKKNNMTDMTYPIFYDLENFTISGSYDHTPKDSATYREIVLAFMNYLNSQNINNARVYSYHNYIQTRLNHSDILKYISWVAHYGTHDIEGVYSNPHYKGEFGWQFTSSDTLNGINGKVDMSVFYNKYTSGVNLSDVANTKDYVTNKGSSEPTIGAEAKAQHIGWLGEKTEGNTAGTSGRNLFMQGLKIELKNLGSNVKMNVDTFYDKQGWRTSLNATNNTVIGKDNEAMQKIRVYIQELYGYRLKYRVYANSSGWSSWIENGGEAGEFGEYITAIEFLLEKADDIKPVPNDLSSVLVENNIVVKNQYLTNVKAKVNYSDLLEKLKLSGKYDIKVIGTNGEVKNNQNSITLSSGDKISFVENNVTYNYVFICTGDTNSDGKVTTLDYITIEKRIMGQGVNNGLQNLASDVSGDEKITTLDYIKIENNIMTGAAL